MRCKCCDGLIDSKAKDLELCITCMHRVKETVLSTKHWIESNADKSGEVVVWSREKIKEYEKQNRG